MKIVKFFALFFLSLNLIAACAQEAKTNLKRKAESTKENPQKPKKQSLRLNAVVKRMLKANDPGIVAYLEKNHAQMDLDGKDKTCGETMLMRAAYDHNLPVMEALIKLKADVNAANISCCNALHHQLTKFGSFDSTTKGARLLIDAKVDVNQQSQIEETPLMYACQQGISALVEPLLRAGADASVQIAPHIALPTLKDGTPCRTALDCARKFKEDNTEFFRIQAGDHIIKTLEEHQKTMDIVRPLIDEHNFPGPVAYIVGEYCGKEKPKEFNY